MISRFRTLILALSLLQLGCTKDNSGIGVDATTDSDSQALGDGPSSDSDAAVDQADGADSADALPEAQIDDALAADQTAADATVSTYIPADPCAEEPVAPAEGSTCTTLDELRCSDYKESIEKSFSLQSTVGWQWLQVCKRLYVLRCESIAGDMHWTKHLAADLVGPDALKASVQTEGIWCSSGASGVALEPGLCKTGLGGQIKVCATATLGRRGCSGSGLVACGTAETIDAMLSVPKPHWQHTAVEQQGAAAPYCGQLGRRYLVDSCSQRSIKCKSKLANGQVYYPNMPSDCIPDDNTGAHCATTCEEIGEEAPPEW